MTKVEQFILLLIAGLVWVPAAPAQGFNQTISGRVVFEGSSTSCNMQEIELESMPMHRVASAYLDSGCAFEFRGIEPGSYHIHLDIDGFREVRQPVDTSAGIGMPGSIILFTSPGRKPVREKIPEGNPYLIDASEFIETYPDSAVDLYQKSRVAAGKGRTEEAIQNLEEALRISPEFYHAYNDLGVLYKNAGRLKDAERAFIRAHEINRTNAAPLVNLSRLYIEDEQPERAVKVSEEAVKSNGRSASAFFNLGLALYKLSRLNHAEDALKKALELAPKMFQVRLALANLYMKLRRVDNVLEQLDGYLAENPEGDNREEIERVRDEILKNTRGDPD